MTRPLDEVRDAKTYTLHKMDLEEAWEHLGLDTGFDAEDVVDALLDQLDSDWDDDYDGVDSYWLEGKVTAE